MRYLFFTLLLFYSFLLLAQKSVDIYASDAPGAFKYRNSVSLELGGHGLIYSFNYERNVINTKWYKLNFQVGASYYPPFTDLRSGLWLPHSINNIFSVHKNHHIETGMGLTPTQIQYYWDDPHSIRANYYWDVFVNGKIGYRYQKPNGRFLFKALFTPLVETEKYYYVSGKPKLYLHPLGALSFGYNF